MGSTILSMKLTAKANRQFHFDECHQLFIRTHNVTPAIATMRVGNPDDSSHGFARTALLRFFSTRNRQ